MRLSSQWRRSVAFLFMMNNMHKSSITEPFFFSLHFSSVHCRNGATVSCPQAASTRSFLLTTVTVQPHRLRSKKMKMSQHCRCRSLSPPQQEPQELQEPQENPTTFRRCSRCSSTSHRRPGAAPSPGQAWFSDAIAWECVEVITRSACTPRLAVHAAR